MSWTAIPIEVRPNHIPPVVLVNFVNGSKRFRRDYQISSSMTIESLRLVIARDVASLDAAEVLATQIELDIPIDTTLPLVIEPNPLQVAFTLALFELQRLKGLADSGVVVDQAKLDAAKQAATDAFDAFEGSK